MKGTQAKRDKQGEKRNYIWITRTSAGYCLTYDDGRGSVYLTPRDPNLRPNEAGYVPYPEAVRVLTNLDADFYASDVDVRIDPSVQVAIPQNEEATFRAVVGALEKMAKTIAQKEQIIANVKRAVDGAE